MKFASAIKVELVRRIPVGVTVNRPATILDASRRIDRVVRYIGDHLDEPLDLGVLAEVAWFSPYHFHRVYRALTAETVAETLRRERLNRAAGELLQNKAPLAAIARRAGYRSVAAFTRAFGAACGVPPAAYRGRGRLVTPVNPASVKDHPMHDVEIRTLEPVRLAALPHH